jgi:hypothetical protein
VNRFAGARRRTGDPVFDIKEEPIMRLSIVLAAAAWGGLFVASQVCALPAANFCELNPDSQLCGGELPPVDPGDPPPPSLCAIDPSLCPPPTGGVLEPVEPEEAPPTVALVGPFRFKGPGFLRSGDDATVELAHDEATVTVESGCVTATGTVVQRGRSGKKHELFLDGPSLDALAGEFAFAASRMAGRGGEVAGKTAKITLKEKEDGALSLKIKIQVVVADLGEVVYKANLSNADGSAPSTLRVLCR